MLYRFLVKISENLEGIIFSTLYLSMFLAIITNNLGVGFLFFLFVLGLLWFSTSIKEDMISAVKQWFDQYDGSNGQLAKLLDISKDLDDSSSINVNRIVYPISNIKGSGYLVEGAGSDPVDDLGYIKIFLKDDNKNGGIIIYNAYPVKFP